MPNINFIIRVDKKANIAIKPSKTSGEKGKQIVRMSKIESTYFHDTCNDNNHSTFHKTIKNVDSTTKQLAG